jgi:hypothetical protein
MIAVRMPSAAIAADAARVPTAGGAVVDGADAALRPSGDRPLAASRSVESLDPMNAPVKSTSMEAAAAKSATVEAAKSTPTPCMRRIDGQGCRRKDNG